MNRFLTQSGALGLALAFLFSLMLAAGGCGKKSPLRLPPPEAPKKVETHAPAER